MSLPLRLLPLGVAGADVVCQPSAEELRHKSEEAQDSAQERAQPGNTHDRPGIFG